MKNAEKNSSAFFNRVNMLCEFQEILSKPSKIKK